MVAKMKQTAHRNMTMAATSGSISRWVLWGGVDQNDHGSCDKMIPYTIWELPLLQARFLPWPHLNEGTFN